MAKRIWVKSYSVRAFVCLFVCLYVRKKSPIAGLNFKPAIGDFLDPGFFGSGIEGTTGQILARDISLDR